MTKKTLTIIVIVLWFIISIMLAYRIGFHDGYSWGYVEGIYSTI